jgi:hypothetical protein
MRIRFLALLAAIPGAAHAVTPADFLCRGMAGGATLALFDSLDAQTRAGDAPSRQAFEQITAVLNAHPKLVEALGGQLAHIYGMPQYAKEGAGSCHGANSREAGVCTQTVECALLTDDDRRRVAQAYAQANGKDPAKVKFANLHWEVREKFAAAVLPADAWKLSRVTCAGSGEVNGVPACPAPDLCKLDVSRDLSEATLDARSREMIPLGTVLPEAPAAGTGSAGGGQ